MISRILIHIWNTRQIRHQDMCPRGNTVTLGSFSPCPDNSWSRFLTASDQFPLVLSPLLPRCPVLLQVPSSTAPLKLLPKAISLSPENQRPSPPRFLLSFTLWFYLRFSLLAQTGERKDGPEVRVIAWAEESRIQFSATDFSSHHGHAISPLSAYHCLLQSTAQRYLLKAGNTLNVMLATSHFRKSCPLQLDGCP